MAHPLGGCLISRLFYHVAAGLVSAGIEVGDKPPPCAELETEYKYSGEDDALTTEFLDNLLAVGFQ